MRAALASLLALVPAGLLGCEKVGCLAGDDPLCVVPSACPSLAYQCENGRVEMRVLRVNDSRMGGDNALASPGDILLENDRVVAVIDAIDHPHYLARTGGSLLDLATADLRSDRLNQAVQAASLLPDDQPRYSEMMLIDEPGKKAVQFRGRLGNSEHSITTRYEIRPCEPGIRIRTELVNLGRDPLPVILSDGVIWGSREPLPFVPLAGTGFRHPKVELTKIDEVLRESAFVAASAHTGAAVAYAIVPCNRELISGFHGDAISSAGMPRRILQPGEYEVLERFFIAANGRSVAPAVDLALEVREKLGRGRTRRLSGRVVVDGLPEGPNTTTTTAAGANFGSGVRASILVFEGDTRISPDDRVPWTQIIPDDTGEFSASVPDLPVYLLEVSAFGKVVTQKVIRDEAGFNLGEIHIPAASELNLTVTMDGERSEAHVLVHPADAATRAAVEAKFLDNFQLCAPLLGPTHGSSPSCNRVLVDGNLAVLVPPGRYHVYAYAGPFSTIATQEVVAEVGVRQRVDLALTSLELLPPSVLSADFHVHGAASFDSSLPDEPRVRSFLASRLDVVVATDHDVVKDYQETLKKLGAEQRLINISGVETTGLVLFDLLPDTFIPKVIGHWNFWPVTPNRDSPYRGGAWDEVQEPAFLFENMLKAGHDPEGIIQLNHPFGAVEFGRDQGWPRAVGIDARRPLVKQRDGTRQGFIAQVPFGATRSNLSYHVQEVMNGSDNLSLPAHRAYWHYLLNNGVLRAGTANSDSHSLVDNVVGVPRNLVYTTVTKSRFDLDTFNADVRAGRMVGTNGPVVEIETLADDNEPRAPSLTPFAPAANAELSIEVRAAPWIPVREIRIVVNGEVKRVITDLSSPAAPLSAAGVSRYSGRIPLAELLPPGDDVWLLVEVGHPLPETADLDCNGIPDTGDNNRDGTIDWRDAEDNDPQDGEPERCDSEIGPIHGFVPPTDPSDPMFHFDAVLPGAYPFAFTNPLVIDRKKDGYSGPGFAPRL